MSHRHKTIKLQNYKLIEYTVVAGAAHTCYSTLTFLDVLLVECTALSATAHNLDTQETPEDATEMGRAAVRL